jgi:hypothetical protein
VLDTAARSSVAPGLSDKYGRPFPQCQPDAAAWLRDGGRLYAVLISYCGLFLDEHGKLSALRPAGLLATAFAGFTVTAG